MNLEEKMESDLAKKTRDELLKFGKAMVLNFACVAGLDFDGETAKKILDSAHKFLDAWGKENEKIN